MKILRRVILKDKKSIWSFCFPCLPKDKAVSDDENLILIEEVNSILIEEKEPATNITILEFMRLQNNSNIKEND